MKDSLYFVYIVQCNDGSLYTGITTDLKKRLRMHNGEIAGGAKYTRYRRPVILRYYEAQKTRIQATKREYEIKCLTRAEKISICDAFTCTLA